MEDKKQPIVIKKIVKGGGHHGGSWKVAFADFATAMMAFFLLLWLMGSTTEEQKGAISEFFNNPSAFAGASATPSMTAIEGPGGASTSMIDLGGALDLAPPERVEVDEAQLEALARQQEQKRLEELLQEIEQTIEESIALKPFKDQILIDITSEGLRIQIVDKENRPMFDLGRAVLKSYAAQILFELSAVVNQVPNNISIAGHTDALPFNRYNYSNWELSADRANAARRALIKGGMGEDKMSRVVGLASTVLYDKDNPASPINRRITIVVMNKAADEAIKAQQGAQPDQPEEATPAQAAVQDADIETTPDNP